MTTEDVIPCAAADRCPRPPVVAAMTSTAEVLTAARALYADAPSHAAPGTMPAPGTYCMITATWRAIHDHVEGGHCSDERWVDESIATALLAQHLGGSTLASWNAEHSTEEVLAVFDAAIASASPK